jgi:hypothetical protein
MNPDLWNRMNRTQRKRVRAVRELERSGVDAHLFLELLRRRRSARGAGAGGAR